MTLGGDDPRHGWQRDRPRRNQRVMARLWSAPAHAPGVDIPYYAVTPAGASMRSSVAGDGNAMTTSEGRLRLRRTKPPDGGRVGIGDDIHHLIAEQRARQVGGDGADIEQIAPMT
jgi:hypothetical protein